MEEYRLIFQDWLRSRDLQIVLLACMAICFAGMGAITAWQHERLAYGRKVSWAGFFGMLILVSLAAIIVAVGR